MPDPFGGWLAYSDNLRLFPPKSDDLLPLYTDIPQISRFWAYYTERDPGIAGSKPQQNSIASGSNATNVTSGSGSGLLANIPTRYFKDGQNMIPVPYFEKIDNLSLVDLTLTESLQK